MTESNYVWSEVNNNVVIIVFFYLSNDEAYSSCCAGTAYGNLQSAADH